MIHTFYTIARYAETDMMGVIHHSVYPIWAEAARTELMKEMGFSYSEIEKSGIMLPVSEIHFVYKAPIFYEDHVSVNCAVTHLDNRRITICYEILTRDILCCIGYSKHVFMNSETRRSMRISSDIIDNFKKYHHPEFFKF